MDQYPKWFLALTFPNVIVPLVTMVFLMFGGVHPFGDVDSLFWSFLIYLFTQFLWLLPVALFFISLFAWGGMRERIAIATSLAGWLVNAIAISFILLD